MIALATVVLTLAVIVLLSAWEGIAVSFLWNAFIVPLGPHIAFIGIRQGLAISLLAGVLTYSYRPRSQREMLTATGMNALNTGFILLVAWILTKI